MDLWGWEQEASVWVLTCSASVINQPGCRIIDAGVATNDSTVLWIEEDAESRRAVFIADYRVADAAIAPDSVRRLAVEAAALAPLRLSKVFAVGCDGIWFGGSALSSLYFCGLHGASSDSGRLHVVDQTDLPPDFNRCGVPTTWTIREQDGPNHLGL